jgi:hypothetical protein
MSGHVGVLSLELEVGLIFAQAATDTADGASFAQSAVGEKGLQQFWQNDRASVSNQHCGRESLRC